jgi:uncharacterized MAPEG superfamily protein
MAIAYWCVLIAAILPYGFTVLAKAKPGYDNRNPREFLAGLKGWRQRAYWAQLNGFEAFPFFAAMVIIAEQLHASQFAINILSIAFIIFRIMHGIFYIFDKPHLRTIVWFAGFGCVIGLFLISI